MSQSFALVDALAAADLRVYLSRAAHIEEGAVRLIGRDGVLAVYAPVLYPHGLLDRAPTVLGLRTFAVDPGEPFDSVVPVRALLDRLERGDAAAALQLPAEAVGVPWAGVSPPRSGWLRLGEVPTERLEEAARAGIAEVATTIPEGTGEQLVNRVRAQVWGRPIESVPMLAAGAAFAAVGLGFASAGEEAALFEATPWVRLTTNRGHVLLRRGGA